MIASTAVRGLLADPDLADLPSRTVARIAYDRWPELFANLDTARSTVRASRARPLAGGTSGCLRAERRLALALCRRVPR